MVHGNHAPCACARPAAGGLRPAVCGQSRAPRRAGLRAASLAVATVAGGT
jgi:hypothetical protein